MQLSKGMGQGQGHVVGSFQNRNLRETHFFMLCSFRRTFLYIKGTFNKDEKQKGESLLIESCECKEENVQ